MSFSSTAFDVFVTHQGPMGDLLCTRHMQWLSPVLQDAITTLVLYCIQDASIGLQVSGVVYQLKKNTILNNVIY
jgi:hypothetical protein